MNRLSNLFIEMRSNKDTYLKSSKGAEFEDRINISLHNIGYSRLIKDDLEDDLFTILKSEVIDKETDVSISNPFVQYKHHFITQPFGSQQYPDFLIFDKTRIVCIETKFSSRSQRHPVWNSGLPRPNGIYIFGSYGRKDLTFFRGIDVVSLDEAKRLHDFFDKGLKAYQNQFNDDEMNEQKYGFSVYIRKAYEQSKKHNPDAIIDYFNNPIRSELEESVICSLKK
ncbi:type II restriction endonuclease [Candidatus Poribacteria bacterium]|nr:type II restriction endonuclease [Candidatus Poribacteria bacterium]